MFSYKTNCYKEIVYFILTKIFIMFYTYVFTQLFCHWQFFFLGRVKLVWIQFSFETGCLTKARESSLPYYLPIVEWEWEWGVRKNGFMSFPRALAQSEMQIALSKIWKWFHFLWQYAKCLHVLYM